MNSLDEPWQVVAIVASFLCVFGLTALLPRALALPVPISTMSRCSYLNGPVITTARPHGISGKLGPKILLWGTGCGELEGPALEVEVLNSVQLLLCDQGPGPAESSQGFCRLTRPGCMIWGSVLGVPILLAEVVLLLVLWFSTLFNAQLVLVAPAILLALCTYLHQVVEARNPLHQRIRWYQGRMKPSASHFGAPRAVSLRSVQEFWSTFESFILQRSTSYVVSNIVVPFTQPWSLSFAEMVGPSFAPFFYVSHLWQWEFWTVLTCLQAHAEGSDATYWIDIFSANQSNMNDEFRDGHIVNSSFYKALCDPLCRGLVGPFPDPAGLRNWLSRSWCLLEIFVAFRQDQADLNLDRVSFCAPSGSLNRGHCSPDLCMECMDVLINLDLRDASASLEEDRAMIGAYIERLGWNEFERTLCWSFSKIIESVERLATRHAETVKKQWLLRNFALRARDKLCRSPPGPQRSISAEQLEELQTFFASVLDRRDMYWVCDEIVKPLTRFQKASYAEFVGCGMVRWFISHWWGMEFLLTVKSILNHAREYPGDPRYWLCTFSNNQWKMHEEIPPSAPPSESSFYKALRSPTCIGTCMILDERVVPLCRAWCLFELHQTFLIQDEGQTRESVNILTSSGVLNSGKCSIDTALAIGKQLTTLNLQDAEASKDVDKDLIFSAVETAGGFEAINAKLKHRIRELISVVSKHFEHDLEQLYAELGKQRGAFC